MGTGTDDDLVTRGPAPLQAGITYNIINTARRTTNGVSNHTYHECECIHHLGLLSLGLLKHGS